MPRLSEPHRPLSSTVGDPVRHRKVVVAVTASLLVGLLSACSAAEQPAPTASVSSAAPSSTESPAAESAAPAAPTLVAGGTATDNLPLFRATVDAVWAGPDNVSGRAYIDALVAAGFDKSAMQVTRDTSTVGNPAESIQFSVLWQNECLVGQVGPATGTAVSVVLPALAEGGCLVGETRPIDW